VSTPSRPPAPTGTWRLARLGGVDVLIKPSLLVMGLVLVAVFAPRFADRSGTSPYVLASAFVIALYVSVLVHELAHVVAAQAFGMRVHSVTMHLLGGETAIEGESRTPWQELSTAIVGPLASLLIGTGALALAGSMGPGVVGDIVWSVGSVNLLVAAFNMLPGLPLDGGRVLMAVIWQLTGRQATGTRVAAWIGRAAAVAVVVLALARLGDGREVALDLVVAALIAWFLWAGAGQALAHAGSTSRIDQLHARRLARVDLPPPPGAIPLPADLHGAALLHAMAARPADAYVLTEDDGSIYGVLTTRAVNDAYRASR
jgi:Zn-dependent protease